MDRVFRTFLENSLAEAGELQARSRVLRLLPFGPLPPSRYLCEFGVGNYLQRADGGTVELRPGPVCCRIWFPEDYLRSTDPALSMKVAAVLNPGFVHPNVRDGFVCLGAGFLPGTPIGALVWELFEIVTYRNCTVDERNALNAEACRLVRAHPALLDALDRPRLFQARSRLQVTVRTR